MRLLARLKKTTSETKASKLSFKQQKELEEIPAKIEQLEAEQNAINLEIADVNIYREIPDKVKILQTRLAAIATEVESHMLRWEALENR